MKPQRRQPSPVSKTAKGLRTRAEEQSRLAVRQAEMTGLSDFYEAPDRDTWDHGRGSVRASRPV